MAQSVLEQEILEQPDIIRTLLTNERENAARITRDLHGRSNYVVIAARGTSDNAARYAQYLFGAHNHLQVALATPSLFTLYNRPPDLSGALIIGISQSGQSPDIVSVLTEGRRQGRPTLSITNDASSPLAQASDYVLPLHAGQEKAVAATKTYTSSLAAMALLSVLLENNPDHLRELEGIPEMMERTFIGMQSSINHVERYRYMDRCNVLGRGYNYATAFEVALKIKELTRVVAEPYSSADFRHGPIATVSIGFPVVLISPKGAMSADMTELFEHIKKLQGELLIISDEQQLLKEANLPLPIPEGLPEWLTPMIAVLPGQLFAMRLTMEKGLNPDAPEGLTKITETL